jgi:hypothetical protein
MMAMKLCEKCLSPAITNKDRFCKEHKKLVLQEMREANYLETRGFGCHIGATRTTDKRENTNETKHGTGH